MDLLTLITLVHLLAQCHPYGQPPPTITIAMLYARDESTGPYKDIAELAVQHINSNTSVLPYTKIKVVYKQYDSTPNSIVQTVCQVLKRGVSGIIIPGSSVNVKMIADTVCQYNIPVIAPTATDPFLESQVRRTLIRMLPSDKYQSTAIFEILRHNNWRQFSILTSFNPYGINGVLELQWLANKHRFKVINVQHFYVPANRTRVNVRDELGILKRSMARVVVLNCNAHEAYYVLQQAYEIGMLRKGYAWIVTEGVTGSHTLLGRNDYFPAYYEGLIGTRPLADNGAVFDRFAEVYGAIFNKNAQDLTPFTKLVYDSMWVIAHALQDYLVRGIELYERKISCLYTADGINDLGQENFWANGTNLTQQIKQLVFDGITSVIEFGVTGSPHNKMYDIVNFRDHNFIQVGRWSEKAGLTIMNDVQYLGRTFETPKAMPMTLRGNHFILGVMEEIPFIIKSNGSNCTGISCYNGYCIDLVKKLAADLNFTYAIIEPRDRKWGGYDNMTDNWDGLVQMLIDKEIDLAAVHLSINSLRERYIDFSVPFMDAGLLTVVKGEFRNNANKFFFLSPFSKEVWYCILLACFFVTLAVCLVNKLSPFGKYGAKMYALMTCTCHKCTNNRALTVKGCKSLRGMSECECKVAEVETESKDRLVQLSLFNASWMVNAALLAQSPVEGGPFCASGRFIVMAWWFFMMIVAAMYTANLAAFLTVSRLHVELQSVEDLLDQDQYKWGTVFSTNPEILMRNSVKAAYRDLIQRAVRVNDAEDGFRRAAEGGFAFIYESPFLEYNLKLACDMVKVGDEFNKFGLAFGMQQNSPYADALNHMILKYRERGELDVLWNKWLNSHIPCPGPRSVRGSTLDMSYLSGLFVTLGIAFFITFFIVIGELVYAALLDAYGDGNRHRQETEHLLIEDKKCKMQRSWRFWAALRRRLKLLKYDISKHWWTIDSFKRYSSLQDLWMDGSTQTSFRQHDATRLQVPLTTTLKRRSSLPFGLDKDNSEDSDTLIKQTLTCVSLGNNLNSTEWAETLQG